MDNFMNHDFDISKILISCFVPAGTGEIIHRSRQSHGLALHLAGEKVYHFYDTNQKIVVKQNDIIYMPKHSNYDVTANEHGDCYAINFDFPEEITFSPFCFKVKNPASVISHFKAAQKSWKFKAPGYITKCKSELLAIIYAMQKDYFSAYTPSSKHNLIQPAEQYIYQKFTEELLSIEKLSAMCGITPEYFRRIFKSIHGVSPIAYINNLKANHAKELLENGMCTVSDAALSSGYTDMSHFSREFKKAFGVSPSKYKKE